MTGYALITSRASVHLGFAMMIYNSYGVDDIQPCGLMIYTPLA